MDVRSPRPVLPPYSPVLLTRAQSSRRRRSRSNLHLNLAPLHALSAADTTVSPPDPSAAGPRSSYLAGRSAPTTPGILSRTASGKSLASRSYTHLAFADMDERAASGSSTPTLLAPSKSTTALAKKKPKSDREWFERIGAAVAGETRESKGQNWLMTRESSTSLVALADDEEPRRPATSHGRRSSDSSRGAGRASRPGSRPGSAKPSRRGSGVGSRVDLASLTPTWRSEQAVGEDYFGKRGFDGPDFVEDEKDEDEDGEGATGEEGEDDMDEDEEVAALAASRTWGLGGFVDRLIGWNLFDVPDQEEEEEEEKRPVRPKEGLSSASNVQLRDLIAGSVTHGEGATAAEKGQGWKDAAWLLSVASKAIF